MANKPRRFCLSTALCLAIIAAGLWTWGGSAADSKNASLGQLPLVPWPRSVKLADGVVELSDKSRIIAEDKSLAPLAKILCNEIWLATGLRLGVGHRDAKDGDIVLRRNRDLKGQENTVIIGDRAVIEGADYNAVSLGTATLLQWFRVDENKAILPRVTISDQPRFEYSGALLDIARKPYSIDTLKQCVEVCRFYKIRFLHLHLSDENAWVFPSAKYPKLGSQNFAWAGGDKPTVYPVADLKELVAFADARGVTFVPELEMPGHSGQLRGTLPEIFGYKDDKGKVVTPGVLNMVSDESFSALDTLVGEMSEVFASSPDFHIGCDEASIAEVEKLPEVTAFLAKNKRTGVHAVFNAFVNRMHGIVKKHGKRMIVWEGAPLDPVAPPKDVIFMPWVGGSTLAAELVKRGYPVINAPWGTSTPILDPFLVNGARLKRDEPLLIGATSILWQSPQEDAVPYLRQTGAFRNEGTYNPDADRQLPDLLKVMRQTDARLDRLLHGFTFKADGILDPQVNLRLDTVFDKKLTLSLESAIPPDRVRYTLDGSEPTTRSTAYAKSIAITKTTTVKARWFDEDGKTPLYTFAREYRKLPTVAHDAVGAKVTFSPERPGYGGPGPKGLTDGFLADGDTPGSAGWVGWDNADPNIAITLDLGKPVKITCVAGHFLRSVGGVALPKSVEFAVSDDGKEFKSIATVDEKTGGLNRGWYKADVREVSARYVRIRPTSGGDWTFTDEVAVNPKLPPPSLRHAAQGKLVTLKNPPSPSYSAAGVAGLTDGYIARSPDFLNPEWLGIEGKDFDAAIDLGEEIDLHEVGVHCLRYVGAGIFVPQSLNVLVSNDGKEFRKVAVVPHKQDDKPAYLQTLSANLKDVKARYVRIVAATNGQWLFVDEVFVNPRQEDSDPAK